MFDCIIVCHPCISFTLLSDVLVSYSSETLHSMVTVVFKGLAAEVKLAPDDAEVALGIGYDPGVTLGDASLRPLQIGPDEGGTKVRFKLFLCFIFISVNRCMYA